MLYSLNMYHSQTQNEYLNLENQLRDCKRVHCLYIPWVRLSICQLRKTSEHHLWEEQESWAGDLQSNKGGLCFFCFAHTPSKWPRNCFRPLCELIFIPNSSFLSTSMSEDRLTPTTLWWSYQWPQPREVAKCQNVSTGLILAVFDSL
jgi:hypothetical protein